MFRNDRLRRARARRKLTQEELAERVRALGVWCSKSRISEWERGTHRPGTVAFAALLSVLRVKATDLVEFNPDQEAV